MFEEVLPEKGLEVIELVAPKLKGFYLAGGTGLALQLGHRISEDFDFFSSYKFNVDLLLSDIPKDEVLYTASGTLHVTLKGIRLSFLYYEPEPVFEKLSWRGIKVADARDIAAEKMKTISQRGAKKDFIDLYAVLKKRFSIPEVCEFFKQRFSKTGINYYHVLRSLVFFEDAEREPMPLMLFSGNEWSWEVVKDFFLKNIQEFEEHLL